MIKINKNNIKPKEDPCGLIRELYHSDNLSVAHVVVLGQAQRHKHERTEEVYYVEKGEGELVIDEKILTIKEGDLVSVPKNSWHYLKKIKGKSLEILVISYPRFDPADFVVEE